MRVAMIGDNCIDIYEKLGRKYPTGNVVDTGVNMAKLGATVSIISTTGSDENGRWMRKTLQKEGVNLSHFKTSEGSTAVTYMDMDGLDRVHGDYVEGVLENIIFEEEDIHFASGHDLVHSALWGKAEDVLPKIKEKNPRCLISFDYADRLEHELVKKTLPEVDLGFYSYHQGRDQWIEEFLADKTKRGMKVAVATFGEKGSLAYDGRQYYVGKVYPAEVVNTVGAGDSFIAGFLYEYLNGNTIEKCLETGARIAADVVSVFEPWVNDKKKRVLCFGDSNTWGYIPGTGERYEEDVRWTGVLASELGNNYRIVEEGLNGRTTVFADLIEPERCGIHHIHPLILSHLPLDYLIVMLGTNDTKTHFHVNATESGYGMEELLLKANYVLQNKKAKTQIILVAPVPIEQCNDIMFDEHSVYKSREIPRIYREIAKEHQCLFLEAGSVIAKLGNDGIHFDEGAHRSLGKVLAVMIKENDERRQLK